MGNRPLTPPKRSYYGWTDFAIDVTQFNLAYLPNYLRHLADWQPQDLGVPYLRGKDSRPMCLTGDLLNPAMPRWVTDDTLRALHRRPDIDWLVLTRHVDRAASVLSRYPGPRYIWFGVAIDGQQHATEQVPMLAALTSFPTRFVVLNPMLEPIWLGLDVVNTEQRNISWVLCGADVGLRRQPFEHQWGIDLLQETHRAGAAFYFLSAGGKRPNQNPYLLGKEWKEWP